ncbi:hypothetical protein EDD11_003114 [Mortierella claussenii]|nr:hypothetical protein EDD11_003114 [Mortierella claussenii]
MDILSRLPVEVAFQILSTLSIQDLAACQRVSRQWYWIAVDQSVWKSIFLESERHFALPTQPASTSSFSLGPSPKTVASARAASLSASVSSTPSYSSKATSRFQSLHPQHHPHQQTEAVLRVGRDWKQECRARVISDRNWSNGRIQSLYTLKIHQGGIARLRLKGGKLLSGDMFGQVAVWNATTYECESLVAAAVGPIQLLDFSAAAMVMTVISKSGICRIWDLMTKALIHSSSVLDVTCMTMNDEYLILGNRDCQIQIVDFMTGQVLKSTAPLAEETLQDIYIQNHTLIVATGHFIRILSIETLEVLMSSPLPISQGVRTLCSVFHIRSLILLTDKHLLHVEWEPLYKSTNQRFMIDTRCELPPNLSKAPHIYKTKVPPISTITSIAIGGNHPHVLTTNADRPSLNDAIRVCPTSLRYRAIRSHQQQYQQSQQQQESLYPGQMEGREDGGSSSPHEDLQGQQDGHSDGDMQMDVDVDMGPQGEVDVPEIIGEGTEVMTTEDAGIVLTSQVEEITQYLETCGLKPSFMDVDEDVVVIGTNKGDIVVLSMMPHE